MRSRAVSFPRSCCAAIRSSPPPRSASAFRPEGPRHGLRGSRDRSSGRTANSGRPRGRNALSNLTIISRIRYREPRLLYRPLPQRVPVRNVTDRTRNPFDMRPSCDRYVPGYGDANADFHVIGDHPGVHGGIDRRPVPAARGRTPPRALEEAGLLAEAGTPPTVEKTYLSYLYMCGRDPPSAPTTPTWSAFSTRNSAPSPPTSSCRSARWRRSTVRTRPRSRRVHRHGRAPRHGGRREWLARLPDQEPAEWSDDDEDALVDGLTALL